MWRNKDVDGVLWALNQTGRRFDPTYQEEADAGVSYDWGLYCERDQGQCYL